MDLVPFFILATTIFTFIFLYNTKKQNTKKKNPPQVTGAWPLIGHLHLLGGPELPHKILGSLANKYGPIFTIKLGFHKVLVISDSKIAKECFTTHDKVFANRPKALAVELMGYNYAMFGLAPYGSYWRHVRKIATYELLSPGKIDDLQHIPVSEIKLSMNEIYGFWLENKDSNNMVKMELKEWFSSLVMNMVVRMLVGKRYEKDDEEGVRSHTGMRRFIEYLGAFVVSDFIPFLRVLDLGGHVKAMKEVGKEMDTIMQSWLDEHKRKRSEGGHDSKDFMDVMLGILENGSGWDLGEFDGDTAIKATCLALLAGAADTTIVTLTWALSLLLNNPHILRRAQEELDVHVSRDQQVNVSDMKNLKYLEAIFKETLRLYPAVPLSVPHESMENCVVDGYNIPKGTRLLANLWNIQRDPKVWSDPNEFQPERFLTIHKELDIKGNHFELIPFGSGRRMCPGVFLAVEIVQLILANLIHGFNLATPSDGPIDMTEGLGLTNLKATPLDILLYPRRSPIFYQKMS